VFFLALSLAASGGYVNIIKLLLNYGAEINSRFVLIYFSFIHCFNLCLYLELAVN
jgi:hypothetical protein